MQSRVPCSYGTPQQVRYFEWFPHQSGIPQRPYRLTRRDPAARLLPKEQVYLIIASQFDSQSIVPSLPQPSTPAPLAIISSSSRSHRCFQPSLYWPASRQTPSSPATLTSPRCQPSGVRQGLYSRHHRISQSESSTRTPQGILLPLKACARDSLGIYQDPNLLASTQ